MDDDLDLGVTLQGFDAGQTVFGRYRLEKVLGRGGMGVVWLAHDAKLDQKVALKFLPELVARDRVAVDDLKRETKRALSLTHEHIVRIHDFVEDEARGLACISMEYVDGENLSHLRLEKPNRCFEAGELAGVVIQLCGALDYAHNKAKVAHRDLKPANLMITSGGDLKVADFGIARSLMDSASRVSKAQGGTSGTLVYMSPQQALGRAATVPDDIYSMGATLYDLLTGRPPFYTGNIYEQLKEITPPSMAERRMEFGAQGGVIPENWEQTIAACLEKDPAKRPQSAEEVACRLGLTESYTAQPVVEPPKPEVIRVERETKPEPEPKRGNPALVAVLILLLGCGAVAGWWFGYEQPKREAEKQAQIAEALRVAEAQKLTDARNQKELDEAAAAAEKQRQADVAAKAAEQEKNIANATKDQPWVNSLGMRFVPVPGTKVLFSIWDTRVQDYRTYAEANSGVDADWKNPNFEQGPTHPAVMVDWEDAEAFCKWLTDKERKEGQIGPDHEYRLPTDLEWSAAVGLPKESGDTLAERNMKIAGVYPWGNEWPPPKEAGNYNPSLKVDDYEHTSPVGSFAANQYGLYDMGGNVWQWCEDSYDSTHASRVLRGASWGTGPFPPGASWNRDNALSLLSSYRSDSAPALRSADFGFRVVLVIGGDSP